MRCSRIRKHLSAFVDNELDQRKFKKVELHISECSDCRQEAEKFRKMIGLLGNVERPTVPLQLWEGTRQRLAANPVYSPGSIARFIKWGFVPAGATVFALLMYFIVAQSVFYKREKVQVPVAVYLQEHTRSYSEQILPSDVLSDLTTTKTSQITEKTRYIEPVSELEVFLEVHYGTFPANES